MFQDSGIILREKNFFRLSDHSESRYRNQVPKAETSPYLQSEKADFPCWDHMERRLDLELGCLIAMRECQSRSKIFLVKKFFNFFSKHVCFMFQDSGIILSEKIFSDFQTNQSPGIAMTQ